MSAQLFDDRVCALGEGPLWHPERGELFWFDILDQKLMTKDQVWEFDEIVSAAGWVDHDTLLIASETQLFHFDLRDGTSSYVCALEAENEITRSNDGRADPWGGFWIGTMGKHAEPGAGAIYRWYRGELRRIKGKVTVSNAICFCPMTHTAYYTDTPTRMVLRHRLDPETGWPEGKAEPFLDLSTEGLNPDGAITDADGNLWLAQWGAHRVAVYDRTGAFVKYVPAPPAQTSCPAFGGPNLTDLYITSAAVGLADATAADGQTFCAPGVGQGVPEPKVVL